MVAVAVGILAGVAAYSRDIHMAGSDREPPARLCSGVRIHLGGRAQQPAQRYEVPQREGVHDDADGGIDTSRLQLFGEQTIEIQSAIGGLIVVTALFFWLTMRRLRSMDVP